MGSKKIAQALELKDIYTKIRVFAQVAPGTLTKPLADLGDTKGSGTKPGTDKSMSVPDPVAKPEGAGALTKLVSNFYATLDSLEKTNPNPDTTKPGVPAKIKAKLQQAFNDKDNALIIKLLNSVKNKITLQSDLAKGQAQQILGAMKGSDIVSDFKGSSTPKVQTEDEKTVDGSAFSLIAQEKLDKLKNLTEQNASQLDANKLIKVVKMLSQATTKGFTGLEKDKAKSLLQEIKSTFDKKTDELAPTLNVTNPTAASNLFYNDALLKALADADQALAQPIREKF